MSNYHVEPAAAPQALTKEAIKSLRKEQVQGLSRRQLMRTAIGAGVAAVASAPVLAVLAAAGAAYFTWDWFSFRVKNGMRF